MDRQEARSFENEPLTTSNGQSGRCENPFCRSNIEPLPDGSWRRTKRRWCSDKCKVDGYVIKRAREMLEQVGAVEFFKILKG